MALPLRPLNVSDEDWQKRMSDYYAARATPPNRGTGALRPTAERQLDILDRFVNVVERAEQDLDRFVIAVERAVARKFPFT